LSQVQYVQASILHESRFAGRINYDYFGAVVPAGADQTFGFSALRLGFDGIPDTRTALMDLNGNGRVDEDDRLDETKIIYGSASDWAFIGSYAKKISEQLSWGGNVKLLHKALLDHSAWGIGFDVSAMYKPMEDLSLGATLTDATKSLLAWDTGTQEFIVPTLRLGAAYRYRISDNHSIMPAVDGMMRFEGRHETTQLDLSIASLDVMGGLEYSYKDRAYLRGGMSEVGQYTIGAGVKLPKLNIDYAFTSQGPDQDGFGVTHRISLMLTLEEAKFAR
jgi:hypothetical protein